MALRIGALLIAGPLHRDLAATLRSLKHQSFEHYRVIVLGDETSCAQYQRFCSDEGLDERFSFADAPHYDTQAAQAALDSLDAETVMFCLAGVHYASDAFEQLYGVHFNEHADVVVGPYIEGNVNTVHRDGGLPLGQELDGFDLKLAHYAVPFARLYSASHIRKNGIRLGEYGLSSYWNFGMRCLASAESSAIRFSGAVVGTYPDACIDDDPTLVYEAQQKALEGYVAAYEDLADYGAQAAGCAASQDTLWNHGFASAWLAESMVEGLAESYINRLWTIAPQSYSLLTQVIDHCTQLAGTPVTSLIASRFAYMEGLLCEGIGVEAYAESPVMTFAIAPDTDQNIARDHLRALIGQSFTPIEIRVAPSTLPADDPLLSYACVQVAPDMANVRTWRQTTVEEAGGSYLVFLKDAIFWRDGAAIRVYNAFYGDREDLAIAMPLNGDDNAFCKVLRLPYRPERCILNARTPSDVYDNSLNNKVFKKSSLTAKGFTFTDNPAADSLAAYGQLDWRKYPFIALESHEGQGFFMGRVSGRDRRLYKLRYIRDILTHVPLRDIADDVHKKLVPIMNRRRKVRDQILFFSNRGGSEMPPSLKRVYDALPDKKRVVMIRPLPHSQTYIEQIIREMSRSRIIVTDDYLHELPNMQFKSEVKVVQLWHAAGAFKKFGLDCFGQSIAKEKAIHSHYTAAMVSSEGVRDIYANAFGIPRERVLALGTARTDELFDTQHIEQTRERLLAKYPEMRDRKVVLFCPTFRQKMSKQVSWDPLIDWQGLSDAMGEEYLLVIRRHPLEMSSWASDAYDNIMTLDEESSNDLMCAADVIMTDYSSVIFDASLLRKPLMFYCPDLDTYERDFYIDFPDDAPGEVVTRWEDIVPAAGRALAHGGDSERLKAFREQYLGACDGHATERIANYIRGL